MAADPIESARTLAQSHYAAPAEYARESLRVQIAMFDMLAAREARPTAPTPEPKKPKGRD